MSLRDTRSRRLPRPPTGVSEPARADSHSLISLLASMPRLIDLLPHLHQRALDETGGSCSLLFESNPRTGMLQAMSGFGLEELRTDPWAADPRERDIVRSAFGRHTPTFVADVRRQMPDLASRLRAQSALMIPLVRDNRRIGLLAIGFHSVPASPVFDEDAREIASAFLTTLEIFRLREKEELQRDIRALVEQVSASLSTTMNLASGLDLFCQGANRLFGADRTSVWIHKRRAHQLVLEASSDSAYAMHASRISAEDILSPPALAMRHLRAEILQNPENVATSIVTVPLRGRRRALGTLVFDGVRVEAGAEIDLLERADELGRQLSSAVENMQLLDDVLKSRGEPDTTTPPDRREAEQNVVAAFSQDMTGRTEIETEREELQKRLTQSEKLAALGQFVAGIAHELNNPLQGVLGHLELLRRTGVLPRTIRKEMTTVYREAERAAKIVRNLLVFAGSRRLARRPVSVNVILQKVVALRHSACKALEIEVVRHYNEKLPRIQSDPLLLHQVFLNMVMNAEHAISASGRPGRIEIATRKGRDRIIATVRDTGNGIPPDALPRIFEPFFTTKDVGQGTGLGLAIVYGIVQEHGGSITAANHSGGGAMFTVELPVQPRDKAGAARTATPHSREHR